MDVQRFDRVTTAFASRFSRRKAVQVGGVGLGAAALGAAGFLQAGAQDVPEGTPFPSESDHLGLDPGERSFTMFVQTAHSGTWAAKDGEEGVYTLTLTGVPAQTIYFSDRPQRIVGTQPTADFLAALGFVEDNPPNAALVTNTDGAEDVLVIELFNPVYTEGEEPTLTYDARVLENYQESGLAFIADRQGDLTMPGSFDTASLFIDGCSDARRPCHTSDNVYRGDIAVPCCWAYIKCEPCHNVDCNSVPGCEGGICQAGYYNVGSSCGY